MFHLNIKKYPYLTGDSTTLQDQNLALMADAQCHYRKFLAINQMTHIWCLILIDEL